MSEPSGTTKNPHAEALGKLGGAARAAALSPAKRKEVARSGGAARAKNLTQAQRKASAKKAAAARWGKKRKAK